MTELIAPAQLSPSSISTFRQCPLKFKYNKIDGMTEPGTQATILGNFVHEILEELYMSPAEERTIELARHIARSIWTEKWEAEASTVVRGERDQNLFRWTAWWCVENLWRLEDPSTLNPWGIERHVEGEIGGVKLHGYIDRLMYDGNDSARVCDYKTGKTPRKNYVDDKFFQLIIYTQLLQSLEINPVSLSVELLYLKDGVRFEKDLTPKDLDTVVSVLQEVREGIEERCSRGYFEPSTSVLCNWCNFKGICPAWNK